MNDDGSEILLWLFLVMCGIALLIFGFTLLALVVFMISAILAHFQYRRYLKEAEEEFNEDVQELGVDLPVDDVLHAMGIEVPKEGGYDTMVDLLAGVPLGVSARS